MSYVNNIKTFVRAYELGSMSAAGRDLRISAAVASNRIGELEKHLGTRLFHRTTRSLRPTRQGEVFYTGAVRILDAITDAEAEISQITNTPRGTIFIAAPLGLGKKLIAPSIPALKEKYPELMVRLRLSDRKIDITNEGLDLALVLGPQTDSELKMRQICSFERVLCAAPEYLAKHGTPTCGQDLVDQKHACLLLRYPGAPEFFWTLQIGSEQRRFNVSGPLESDDGDVLTAWALSGCGIINKPRFEVADHLASGTLVEIVTRTPPTPLPFACLYAHKRLQDPKARLFLDHVIRVCEKIA